MNKEIVIWVEGKTDLLFLCQVFKYHFNQELTIREENKLAAGMVGEVHVRIQIVQYEEHDGGIDIKKIDWLAKEIQREHKLGVNNFIIFDTDTKKHTKPPGGFEKRSEYLRSKTEAKFFLLPNNKDDGNLESLLLSIVSDKGQKMKGCIRTYKDCLKSIPPEEKPAGLNQQGNLDKKVVEWYMYLTYGPNHRKSKTEGRDYMDTEVWNMSALSLKPLLHFLKDAVSDNKLNIENQKS